MKIKRILQEQQRYNDKNQQMSPNNTKKNSINEKMKKALHFEWQKKMYEKRKITIFVSLSSPH